MREARGALIEIEQEIARFLFVHIGSRIKTPANPEGVQAPYGAGKFPTGHAFEIILPNMIHKSKKRNLK